MTKELSPNNNTMRSINSPESLGQIEHMRKGMATDLEVAKVEKFVQEHS